MIDLIDLALLFTYGCLGVSLLLTMLRLIAGPTLGDRVLALDTLSINAVALIVLIGIAGRTQLLFEAALIIAMLGFVSTVAYCRFAMRGDIIE